MEDLKNRFGTNIPVYNKPVIGMCKYNGKYWYYISKCIVTTPYSNGPENKIKLEYPEKGKYGYKFFNPGGDISSIILFIFKDFAIRTDNLAEIIIKGHCQKGREYTDEEGAGWCAYKCIHKPLSKEKYAKIMGNFDRLKNAVKKGDVKTIDEYLSKYPISN